MSTTVRELAHQKLYGILSAGLSGVTVERNRSRQVQTFPSVIVLQGGHTPDHGSTGITVYTIRPSLEIYVQTDRDDQLAAAFEDLYGRIVAILAANQKLDGVAIDMREGEMDPVTSLSEFQRPTAGFALQVEIEICTAEGDPYSADP